MDNPITPHRTPEARPARRNRIIDWLAGQGAGNLTIYMMFLCIVATLIMECLRDA